MIRVAILTVSDSAADGTRQDLSGPALAEHCRALGWLMAATAIVPDDPSAISQQLIHWADQAAASLILTTGGTGLAARDNTPEATRAVVDREIPGMVECMRIAGAAITERAWLSRGIAGSRKGALLINLPGSPKGALESLRAVERIIPHAIDLLEGRTSH